MKNLPWAILLLLPAVVVGKCTCESDELEGRNRSDTLKYKLAAIATILVGGTIGICLPEVSKNVPALSPDRRFFFMVKAFAAGVILSTGFVHVLPEAFEKLTSPSIGDHPWGHFPFTGPVAMLSAVGTLMVDVYATSYYALQLRKQEVGRDGCEGGAVAPVPAHGHAHGSSVDSGESDLPRHRVISQVLEMGIIVHSVIIGIALGVSESPKTIKPLFAALTFHQFFEGIGLGSCITQARFKAGAVAIMAAFFCLTTPTGIAIGIGITNHYSETSSTALIVEGLLNSASAGILIYMALVDLLAADFMSPKMQTNVKLLLWANIFLLFGAGCMSVLAYWA